MPKQPHSEGKDHKLLVSFPDLKKDRASEH
jgi:hypothetical protein